MRTHRSTTEDIQRTDAFFAQEMLKAQRLADRLRRDREAEVPDGAVTLKSAPFFRHWLNTGFYRARDRESGGSLLGYLNQELPFLPEWSRKFVGLEDGTVPPPPTSFTTA